MKIITDKCQLFVFSYSLVILVIFISSVSAAPVPVTQSFEINLQPTSEYLNVGILPMKRPEVDDAKDAPGIFTHTIERDVLSDFSFPINETSAVYVIKQYLRKNSAKLNSLDVDALQLKSFYILPKREEQPETFIVEFRQTFDGLDIDGTFVRIIGKKVDGQTVIRTQARIIPEIAAYVESGPQLDNVELKIRAKESTREQGENEREERSIRFVEGQWRKIYETSFNGKSVVTLDATNGQTIGSWESVEPAGVHGNVSGNGLLYQFTGSESYGPINLRDMEVRLNSSNLRYTDTSGNFDFGPAYPSGNLEVSMEGRWVEVFDEAGLFQDYNNFVNNSTPTNVTFNAFNDSPLINVYHHTTIFRNQWKQDFPSLPGLNAKISAYVREPSAPSWCTGCIGWYQGWDDTVHFLSGYAQPLLAYHEYGHHMDRSAGGITNSSLSEGWAYLLSSYATGNSEAQIGWNISSGWWDPSETEPHNQGRVFAAFAWKIYQNLGPALARSLMTEVLMMNSSNIPEAVMDTLIADDNDNNLTNGTPHSNVIMQAAVDTNLDQFVNISVPYTVAEITYVFPDISNQVSIWGIADAPAGSFLSYQLFYGAGTNPTTWTAITSPSLVPAPNAALLGVWDTTNILSGVYTIKLVVRDSFLHEATDTVSQEIYTYSVFGVYVWSSNEVKPDISHNRVVWQSDLNGSQDIYTRDLDSYATQRITNNPADQIEPKISDNYIVWTDMRADASRQKDIFGYNISTHQEIEITMDLGNQEKPAISGTKVVWQDNQNGNWDIYWKSLSSGGKMIAAHPFPLYSNCPTSTTTGTILAGCLSSVVTPVSDVHRLTTNPADQTNPDISGNRVVWEDRRNGGTLDIYMYDLNTNVEQRITTAAADPRTPRIDGDIIVWSDSRDGDGEIYYYDLRTNQEYRVTTNTVEDTAPQIWGRWIVYHRNLGSVERIYVYDILLHTENEIVHSSLPGEFVREPVIDGRNIIWNQNNDIYGSKMPLQPIPLTTHLSNQTSPSASAIGDDFSFQSYQSGNPEIYVTKPLSLVTEQITNGNHQPVANRMYSNKVIWVDDRNGNQDIFGYNRLTHTEFSVVVAPGNQFAPSFYGDKVVWQDSRNGNMDIYLKNLTTGQEVRITSNSFDQENPVIYGNKIVWEDLRDPGRNLYLCEYNDSSGTPTCPEQRITATGPPRYATDPYIFQNKIVWTDRTNYLNNDIYMCEYNNSGTGPICPNIPLVTENHMQTSAVVRNNLVAWVDSRSGNPEIYILNLNTNQTQRVTTDPNGQTHPQFSGDWIIWEDTRNGNFDIYGVRTIEAIE